MQNFAYFNMRSHGNRHCTGKSGNILLKGTATLMISMFDMKELYEPLILIPVSSKSVGKYGSCGRLNICKWTIMEAAIL